MRNFILGLLIGLSLALGISVAATSKPKITGGTGTLEGIEVIGRDGRTLCEDPEYLEAQSAVSCE